MHYNCGISPCDYGQLLCYLIYGTIFVKMSNKQLRSATQRDKHDKQVPETDMANPDSGDQILTPAGMRAMLHEVLDEKIQPLTNLVANLQSELDSIKDYVKTVENTATDAFKKNGELQTELTQLQQEHDTLHSKYNELHQHILNIETQSRRDNLCFDGVPEESGETDAACEQKVRTLLKDNMNIDASDMKIVRCHRLGPPRKNALPPGKPRSLIVKFHFYGDRSRVWDARRKLKGSPFFVSENFPNEIEARRRRLWPVFNAARRDPALKGKVSLRVDRLILNGQAYTVNTLDRLPPLLQPENIATKVIGEKYVCFWGRDSPFSNFYESNFTIGGNKYNCVEQYFVQQKALFFGDDETAAKVMKENDPGRQKALGTHIQDFDPKLWRNVDQEHMQKALLAKFEQNPALLDKLISTNDKILVETTRDKYWGAGTNMYDPQVAQGKWPGSNRLGSLLVNVREQLK